MKLFLAMLVTCVLAAYNTAAREYTFSIQLDAISQRANQSEELSRADAMHAEVVELFKKGKYDQALTLAKQVVDLREKAVGPDHPIVAVSLQNVAELLIAKNKRQDAAEIYSRSLAIYEKARPASNAKLIESLDNYICLLTSIGKRDEVRGRLKHLFELENGFDESIGVAVSTAKADKTLQGRALNLPRPEYVPEARAKRIAGAVVMKVKVNEQGKVIGVTTLCGDPILSKASSTAVWGARFQPAVINGKPVQFVSTLTYNFVIQ